MTTDSAKTLYESPDKGWGQTFIYQEVSYPQSLIIVQTDRNGREAKVMLVSKEAILLVAKQLETELTLIASGY